MRATLLAAFVVAVAPAALAADPPGQAVFAQQCAGCHALDPDEEAIGPSLLSVVGRHAGAVADYDYSPAMRRATQVWTADTLDAYLKAPQAVVPGTKMTYPGLADPVMRRALVAYLATLKAPAGAPR